MAYPCPWQLRSAGVPSLFREYWPARQFPRRGRRGRKAGARGRPRRSVPAANGRRRTRIRGRLAPIGEPKAEIADSLSPLCDV